MPHLHVRRAPAAPALGRAASGRRLRVAKLGMYLSGFMAVVNISVVYLAVPAIEKSLHAGLADQQWILSIYPLMEGGFTLAGGTLGDLYGRKRIMTIGTWLFIFATLGCALAHSARLLIVARALQGLGGAVLLSLPVAILVQMLPNPTDNEGAIKTFATVAGLGAVAGPVIGGMLVHWFAWPAVFYLSVAMAVIVLFALPSVDESQRDPAMRLDGAGQVFSILSFLATSFGLIEGNAKGWGSPLIIGAFVLAAVSFAAFVLVEARAAHPMIHLRYFTAPRFNAAMLAIGAINFCWYGVMLLCSLFLQSVQHQSALLAGFYLVPSNVAFFVSNQYSGKIEQRLGQSVFIALGMIVSIVGIAYLATLGAASQPWQISAGLFVAGLGWGFVFTPATSLGMKVCAVADEGFASGALALSRSLFGVFGIAVLGSVLAAGMRAVIASGLSVMQLGSATQAQILAALNHGGAFAIASSPPAGVSAVALLSLVSSGFVHGARLAFVIAAALTLVLTIVIYALSRTRPVSVPAQSARARA